MRHCKLFKLEYTKLRVLKVWGMIANAMKVFERLSEVFSLNLSSRLVRGISHGNGITIPLFGRDLFLGIDIPWD
jgi:hypothetical protein